jgi:uncharacterized membrane protein (UPF0127 family)
MSQHFSNRVNIPLFESYCRKHDVDGVEIEAQVANIPLKLKVASTPESQAQGYMNADSEPADGEGILFVYDADQPLGFWMKDVRFPLDVIFFDSFMNYLGHETMEPGEGVGDHEQKIYSSKKPARFAVEVPAGWCNKNISGHCKLSF